MQIWSGEVSVRLVGKSYWRTPATFVSVEASNYVGAVGKAIREAKRRLAEQLPRKKIEAVIVKLEKAKATKDSTPLKLDGLCDGSTGKDKD
jgi:hypothetical protein